jgi:ubiquinone/menaquinone biosynthesis C-methylase UbiE
MSIDKRRIEESYDTQAETYKGSRQLVKMLLRDVQIPPNPSGLDIGCGPGDTTFELYDQCGRRGRVIGVDISQKMVEKAFQNGRDLGYSDVQFVKMDAESLDFKDDTFDVVICIFTFQFFPDKMKALKEMYRVLRPGGYLGLFFTADKMFMHESFEIFRKIEEKHPELSQFSYVLDEYGGMHITLEEFMDMLYGVGFTGLDFFGKHRVYYVNPGNYLEKHPYPLDLFSAVPVEDRGLIIREAYEEMVRLSDPRGFKLTHYFIQGIARKPGEA